MNELRTGTGIVPSARVEGQTLIASVRGEIDLNNSPELRRMLLDVAVRHAVRRVLLNLAEVPYMDSSAIAVLVELLRRMGKGGTVALTHLQPRVRGLLEIARLDSIFVLADNDEEAHEKLKGKA